MSDNIPKYKATDKMSDLICENYTLLMVMSRFGLPLGFGDKNVKEVCDACNVDYKTFLAVVNFMDTGQFVVGGADFSIQALMAILILKFYDEYVNEVRRHMEYEDNMVFGYVLSLLEGKKNSDYNILVFARKHNQIQTKLTELKNIIIKYYPAEKSNNSLNSVLFDIYSCEQDLASHCNLEDLLFVPAVAQLEKKFEENEK